MSLREIAVKTQYITDVSYAHPVDAMNILRRSYNAELELHVRNIVNQWKRLIMRNRPNVNFDDIESETVDSVVRMFDGRWDTLEAYVKRTALKIPVTQRRVEDSIDRIIELGEGEVSILDTLTEDNRLGSDAFAVNVGIDGRSLHSFREEMLWSDWLTALRERDNSSLVLSSEDVILLVNMSPLLGRLVGREFDEVLASQLGTHNRKNYKSWMREVVVALCNKFNLTRDYVKANISTWVSLYLQNTETLQRQFALSLKSEIYDFQATRNKVPPFSATITDDTIFIKAKKWYNIYKLDLEPILDKIYDDYFESDAPLLSFELNGQTFYNVLGGIFTSGGDFTRFIAENVCEYVLRRSGDSFIVLTDKVIYFESRLGARDFMYYWYYYGMNFSLYMELVGKQTFIEGTLI